VVARCFFGFGRGSSKPCIRSQSISEVFAKR
jgi:hypothetical protein